MRGHEYAVSPAGAVIGNIPLLDELEVALEIIVADRLEMRVFREHCAGAAPDFAQELAALGFRQIGEGEADCGEMCGLLPVRPRGSSEGAGRRRTPRAARGARRPPRTGTADRLHAPAGPLQHGHAVDPLAQCAVQEQRRHGRMFACGFGSPAAATYCRPAQLRRVPAWIKLQIRARRLRAGRCLRLRAHGAGGRPLRLAFLPAHHAAVGRHRGVEDELQQHTGPRSIRGQAVIVIRCELLQLGQVVPGNPAKS